MSNDILFEMYRGDDMAFRIEFNDEQGNPLDITGWEFFSTMKLDPFSADDEAPVHVDIPPIPAEIGNTGAFELLLPSDQTKNLLPTKYHFDLQRKFNNRLTTVMIGRIRVLADVTIRSQTS